MNKGNQTKNDFKQEQLLLTLGGLKPTLESGFKTNQDYRTAMQYAKADLQISIGASGRVKEVKFVDANGKEVGNLDNAGSLAGYRRFTGDAVKEAERESADDIKIFMAKKVNEEGKTFKKVTPAANARVAEIHRISQAVITNIKLVQEWYVEDESDVERKYVLKIGHQILSLLLDELRDIMSTGKTVTGTLIEGFKYKKIPMWIGNKFVNANALHDVDSFEEMMFPRNYLNGIKLRTFELAEPEFLEQNYLLVGGNHRFIKSISELVKETNKADSIDGKRLVKEAIQNFEWNMVPQLEPEEMIGRYKEPRTNTLKYNYPTGEANAILRKSLPMFHKFNIAWNKYCRMAMYDDMDDRQFWKKYVTPSTYSSWVITQYNTIQTYVKDLETADFINWKSDEFYRHIYHYCLSQCGIYDPEFQKKLVEKLSHGHYMDRNEIMVAEEEYLEAMVDAQAKINAWEIKEKEKALIAAPTEDGDDKVASVKEEKKVKKPSMPEILSPMETNYWIVDQYDMDYGVEKYMDPEDKLGSVTVKQDEKAKTCFNFLEHDIIVEREDREKYEKYFQTKGKSRNKQANTTALLDDIPDEAQGFLNDIGRNAKYGKEVKMKLTSFIQRNFAGSPIFAIIMAKSVKLSLEAQDFWEDPEEEDGN
jgi:hypothetical protein